MSRFVKKESDYMRILPTDGEEVGGSAMYHSGMLEKKIVHARILNTFQEPFEVEDENHYERRVQFDLWVSLGRDGMLSKDLGVWSK